MLAYPANHSSHSFPNTQELIKGFQEIFFQRIQMEEKRLDFNAPLLSVRRIVTKKGLGTKTVGNPGFVPFTWEQTPGRPKDRILIDNGEDGFKIDKKKVREGEDEVISSNESFFDCSGSDHSDSPDDLETSESFLKDREVHEFMMGRFLPAAKAVATGPLEIKDHQRFKEKAGDLDYRRPPVSLPYQHTPTVSKFAYDHELESYADEDEDVDEDYAITSHFNRACGLIPRFCLKSSFLLMNLVPGMKLQRNLHPRSRAKVSDHGSFFQTEDESWDAVYKYKRGQRNDPLEDESKLSSESNQLTYWSDSQTVDESSFHHSPRLPFREGNESLVVPKRELNGRKTVSFDSCERVCENYRNLVPCAHGKCQYESSVSPSVDKTICVVDAMESPNSKLSSIDGDASIADKNSGVMVDDRRLDDSPVLGNCVKHELQPKISKSMEVGLSSSSDRSNIEGIDCNNDGEWGSKVEDKGKSGAGLALSLLPPPLPNCPSDSWLQRTLPSVSSKYPFTQSLLSIQVQHRKQRSWASPKDFNWENESGAVKRQPQQTRFAQMLTKPAPLQYEP